LIRQITRPFLLVSFFFALDKLVAFLRQILFARTFGISASLDAFNAANNLPDLVFAVISGGAMAIAVVPLLTDMLDREGRDAVWVLFSRLANWAFILTAILAALLALFATPLIRYVVAPGFTVEQQTLTATLMRLDVIALLLFSISGLVIGGLQAQKHFFLPALAPVMYNIGQILGVLFFAPRWGVVGLAYGTILGACLHLLIQTPALLRYGFRWTPAFSLLHPGIRKAAALMGPRLLTVAAIQIIFLTTDNFASRLVIGSVTAIAYGWLLLQVPETIIGSALGTVLLPTLSEIANRGEWATLRQLIRRAAFALLGVTIPVAFVAIVLVEPAVRLVFEHGGSFTSQGTSMVAAAARLFFLGLPAQCLVEIAVRAFYARLDAVTPLLAAILTAITFVALCFLLVPLLGFTGIALANTLAFTTECAVLYALLHRRQMV
jgi:putative peptidoglycan lipid II flippase